MSDGISAMRNRKAARAARTAPAPRHPKPPAAVEPAVSAVASSEQARPAVTRKAAAAPAAAAPIVTSAPAAVVEADVPVSGGDYAVPDLTIDWSDPLMHIAAPTRVSVANSVASRFKAVAEQPGSAPQTELIMEAVSRHLAQLPALVLKRRPEEAGPAGFFVRRAPVQKAEPWQPVYIRPNGGELEALKRIVDWVNEVILDGHPGRRKSSRSEILTAALDASYPPKSGRA